jgi:hypothetical protein
MPAFTEAHRRRQRIMLRIPGRRDEVARKAQSANLIVVGLLVTLFARPNALSQVNSSFAEEDGVSAERNLVTSIESEEKKGVSVFYTQAFVDTDNQRTSYSGSIYGAINAIKIDGCRMHVDFIVADSFFGVVGKRPTGHLQDTSSYSLTFSLISEIADDLRLIEGRPIQLRVSTHAVCSERSSCSITWLRIKTKNLEINETRITNDAVDFQGTVDHILIPLSSADSGDQLIALFRSLARVRCN